MAIGMPVVDNRTATRPAACWHDRVFYCSMAAAAAVSVFVGFAPTFYLRSNFHPGPLPLYLYVHGSLFTAWIALFFVQTSLIAARRTDVHRRLGWVGAALASSMVAAGVTVAIFAGRRAVAEGHEDAAVTFLPTA